MTTLKTFFQSKLITPIIGFLKQGVTPKKLALSISLGATIGVFPVLGSTTILCGLIAFRLKLNQPVTQLVNYFIYPVQLILFIFFFKLGGYLFSEPFSYSLSDIYAMMTSDFWKTFNLLWISNLRAILVWMIIAPIIAFPVYLLAFSVLKKFNVNLETESEIPPLS